MIFRAHKIQKRLRQINKFATILKGKSGNNSDMAEARLPMRLFVFYKK